MLKNIHIEKFKCLEDEELEFSGLTVLAGKNSSGKSTVLQSILIAARNCNPKNKERMYGIVSKYQTLPFNFTIHDDTHFFNCSNDKYDNIDEGSLEFEKSLYYLSSNRIGQEDLPNFSKEYKVGDNGEFLLGTYLFLFVDKTKFKITIDDCHYLFSICNNANIFKEIGDSIVNTYNNIKVKHDFSLLGINNIGKLAFNENLRNSAPPKIMEGLCDIITIPVAINCWLSYITESKNSFLTEMVTSDRCKAYFQQKGIGEINPFNVGTGMSFLVKVLILCFLAKPGDVVIIENPEIHLHPKAQSRLGEFFSFLASKKIQLIIETHCEHLINSLRYQVYKKKISKDDIVIHYKEDENTHFQKIRISDDGYYLNTDGKKIPFPNGFFDVSVQQLMEIGL